jgi:AcrR family transcriptional regulator
VGVAQRRVREREQLRGLIIDAARDLLLEQGLSGLSMRAIAERIEYSPATIYLYFTDKDDLLAAIVETGFERLSSVMAAELARLDETAGPAEQYCATGRAYARFGVENPSYFRVMFELPSTAELDCPGPGQAGGTGFDHIVDLVTRATAEGELGGADPRQMAITGWGLIHGLTTLYLSGHLRDTAPAPEAFFELIEDAMRSLNTGWRPCGCVGEDV